MSADPTPSAATRRRTYLAQTAAAVQHTAAELPRLLREAESVQWEAGRKPGRAQSGGRSKGTHSDPTSAIALDPARTRLREAVREAEKALEKAAADLERAHGRVSRAIDAWAGH